MIVLVFGGMMFRLLIILLRPAELRTDPDAYVALARGLASGSGFSTPGSTIPTAFRPPLYPLALSGLFRTGISEDVAVACVNLLASVFVIVATWWIGRSVGLTGKWLILATTIAVFDPLMLRYAPLPMTETISAALLGAAFCNAIRMVTRQQNADAVPSSQRHRPALYAGLFFGLGMLCRPIILATFCLTAAFLWIHHRICRQPATASERNENFRAVALMFAAAAAVLLPWIIRNGLQFGRFVPATSHGGYTLLLANNNTFYSEVVRGPAGAVWQEESLKTWQQQLRSDMSADGIDPTDEFAADKWMYARARRTIAADPRGFLQSCLLRWKRFWALTPGVTVGNGGRWMSACTGVWFTLLWLGVAGSLFCGIRARCDIQMLWLAILSFLIIHTFYWTNTRMRAPLTSVFAILSVVGWQYWFRLWQHRPVRS